MAGLGAVQETEPPFFITCWPRRALTATSVLSVVNQAIFTPEIGLSQVDSDAAATHGRCSNNDLLPIEGFLDVAA